MRNNPRLIRAASILQRRTFLKALGLGLAVPVAARMAKYATAQTAAPAKRFVVIYIPHGVAPEHYNPRVSASDPTSFDLDKTNESGLAPLQPYRKWVNVYQGFGYAVNEGTHEGIVNCLSGYTGDDADSPRMTLEHVIGKSLGIKPLILGACSHRPTNFDLHGRLFWDGTAIEPEKDPSKVADKLFGAGTAQPSQPADAEVQLRNDLLKLTEGEIQELKTTVTGLTNEQNKLQVHLEAVQQLQGTGNGPGGPTKTSCSTRPNLPTVEKVRQASAGQVIEPSGANDYFYQEANFRILFQAQLELMAQAMICNVAPIIGLMPMYATCEFDFSFVGGSGPSGSWAHHTGVSHTQHGQRGQWDSPVSIDNADPATRPFFGRTQRWFHQQIVDNLISVLAMTPDPTATNGSTVLDNSLIYLMSEIGDGAMHTRVSMIEYPQIPAYLPLVSIGGAGGAIKTQQVVNFAIAKDEPAGSAAKTARPATELYLTFAKAMGAMDATFPNASQVVPGVLT